MSTIDKQQASNEETDETSDIEESNEESDIEESNEETDDEESDDEEIVAIEGPVNADGLPHGSCKVTLQDGRTKDGEFVDGLEHGYVREYYRSDDGASVEMINEGRYEHGQRVGVFLFYFTGGGVLQGRVDADSQLVTDPRGVWWYQGTADQPQSSVGEPFTPHAAARLVGEWKDSQLVGAVYADDGSGAIIRWDPTRANHQGLAEQPLASEPLLADPYESETVQVGASTVPGGGQGLFAKRRAAAGTVVAFYSGCRVLHSVVDARSWAANANTISLDDQEVIDVPPEWNDTDRYRASLGHKCNHAFPPHNNCKYSRYFHPRFGYIRAITTIRQVEPGEELFVDYDYNQRLDDGTLEAPDWYTALIDRQQAKRRRTR